LIDEYVRFFERRIVPDEVLTHQQLIEQDVRTAAKMGAHLPENKMMRTKVNQRYQGNSASHWATNTRLECRDAIFLNAIDAAAFDYDPVHAEAVMHADIVVLPALDAMYEAHGTSRDTFHNAHILGSEFACRLALASGRRTDWFESSIFGLFGAVLACGLSRQWQEDAIEKAFGIALGMASGTKAVALQSTTAKRLLTANAARSAVEALELTEAGFEGPRDPLFGTAGLSEVFDQIDFERCRPSKEGLYTFMDIELKPYPSCLMCHEPIRCAFALHSRLTAEELENIENVRIYAPIPAIRTAGSKAVPEGRCVSVSSMFSIQYCVACVLLRGQFSIEDVMDFAVMDPEIQRLLPNIELLEQTNPLSDYGPIEIEVIFDDARSQRITSDDIGPAMQNEQTAKEIVAAKALQLHAIENGEIRIPSII